MFNVISLKNNYSTGYNEPIEFFTEMLLEASYFDLGLGYFSSSAIRSLSAGFAVFISSGGRMRVLINDVLSVQDKTAILNGLNNEEIDFESRILNNIKELKNTLSHENELFFKCFSYLISVDRIQFVATTSAKGGLSHDKYGIFTDRENNKVAFIGSANFSKSALELNSETITVFSSLRDSDRVKEYEFLFNESWNNDTPHIRHISIESVKTFIVENFTTPSLEELISLSISLRTTSNFGNRFSDDLLNRIRTKESGPRFPFAHERDIQVLAYTSWLANNYKGIFAMATGTGKTVTALNCVLKLFLVEGYYKVIVVVPTVTLAFQWEEEARKFNFTNLCSTSTSKDWKDILARYTTFSHIEQNRDFFLITTYATFVKENLQKFVKQVKGIEDFIFIADEAHNLGSPISLSVMPFNINRRIGLSATPERIYDDYGSNQLYGFFNSYPPVYTYRYTLREAIENDILCHYEYFPLFVELRENEMKEYIKITNQLRKFIDSNTGNYKKEAEALLLKRKRIIHKAENKKNAVFQLLMDFKLGNKLNYTFVFVPEGFEPDYSIHDIYNCDPNDIRIIDEYSKIFSFHGYKYHKFYGGIKNQDEILESFSSGDIDVILAMKCLDEGIDIPRAENAIFCSSTGNPRQFIQRRGRVLRKCEGKMIARIWDLVVVPPKVQKEYSSIERNLFVGELKRILDFASMADNRFDIIWKAKILTLCQTFNIDISEFNLN
jgi:superfamily II DNA or RNA helicase